MMINEKRYLFNRKDNTCWLVVIQAAILESPWVILLQLVFFSKNATNAIKLVSLVLWKSWCVLSSLNTLTMLQAASCPFLLLFFFSNTTSLSGDDFISYAVTTYMGKTQEYTKTDIFHQARSVNGFCCIVNLPKGTERKDCNSGFFQTAEKCEPSSESTRNVLLEAQGLLTESSLSPLANFRCTAASMEY